MGTSGNPAKAAEAKISSASEFKKKRAGVIELPSGMTVRLRNPGGLRIFMANGSIPNSLMPLVKEALDSGTEMDAKKTSDVVDQDTITEMMEMMDRIAVTCFVEPRCYPVPEDDALRDDNLLYADEVEDEDKMFIFQWVSGGTEDVATFRAKQASNVAALSGQPEVGSSPE